MIKTRYGNLYGVKDEKDKMVWFPTKSEAKWKLREVYTAKLQEIASGNNINTGMAEDIARLTNKYKDYIK